MTVQQLAGEFPHLYIEVTHLGAATVLSVEGDLCNHTAATLHARIGAALDKGQRHLVIEMSGLGFLDSEGIGLLVRSRRALKLTGGTLVLACAPQQAQSTLAVKGLAQVLPAYPDATTAARAIEAGEC